MRSRDGRSHKQQQTLHSRPALAAAAARTSYKGNNMESNAEPTVSLINGGGQPGR